MSNEQDISETAAYKLSAIAETLREIARQVDRLYETEKAEQLHEFGEWESVLDMLDFETDKLQCLYDALPEDASDE